MSSTLVDECSTLGPERMVHEVIYPAVQRCEPVLRGALAAQVGILRRGRYVKGKKIGKAPIVDVVRLPAQLHAISNHPPPTHTHAHTATLCRNSLELLHHSHGRCAVPHRL